MTDFFLRNIENRKRGRFGHIFNFFLKTPYHQNFLKKKIPEVYIYNRHDFHAVRKIVSLQVYRFRRR